MRIQPEPLLRVKKVSKFIGFHNTSTLKICYLILLTTHQISHWKWKEEKSLFVKVSFWQRVSSVSQGQHLHTSSSYCLKFDAVGLKFPKCTTLGCDHTCIWTASCFVAEFDWAGNRRKQNRSGLWNDFFLLDVMKVENGYYIYIKGKHKIMKSGLNA